MAPSSRHILITGGSSGIGEALALAYAAPDVTLSLTGRNQNRLGAVCRTCRERGADAIGAILDVADAAAMAAWITERDNAMPLDLVIANAGMSGGTAGIEGGESGTTARRILSVNINGVINTVLPAVTAMRPRRRGQIAIMSSLAGFRGIGTSAAYGASKAAVRVWGESIRPALAAENIWVSVICPGFVRSRITDMNKFRMPFLMDGDKAAAIIKAGLERRRSRIAFPWPTSALVWFFMASPDSLAMAITRWLPTKE